MKTVKKNLTRSFLVLFLLFLFFSCTNNKERFEDPPWLGGSSIETLEDEGNYTIFLELMEKAKYTEPISKQLFTLFVPNDEAFQKYFAERGISGVDAMSEDEAVQLFTLHVLRNPRSSFQLIYEFAWNELQGPEGEYASLFFRKQTNSHTFPYIEIPRYHRQYKGKERWLTYSDKLLPLFSVDYFEDFFGAVDGSDYTFMYRDSEWGGNINWHNAMVTDAEVRTSSGFIYYIDRVVPPTPNLEEYLFKNQDKYGLFYDLAQRFANYTSAGIDEFKRQLWEKSYDMISNFAEEQGPSPSDDPNVPTRMKDLFTMFVPTDAVLQKYLDEKVLKYYSSIDSVPQITLYYILQTHISLSLALKSKAQRSFFNAFGDFMPIDPEQISDAYMCSNGLLYEMKEVLEPNVFSCVPGRLYMDKNYSTFLHSISSSNLIGELTNPDIDVTLFAPNNDEMEEYGIRYNETGDLIQKRGTDGIWAQIKEDELKTLVQDHIYYGVLSDFSGEGFIEMSSKNYVYYNNNALKAGENVQLGDEAIITGFEPNERNGMLIMIQKPIKSKWVMGQQIMNDPDMSEFANLMIQVGMLDPNYVDQVTKDTIPNLSFLNENDYWTAFIPDNDAVADAISEGYIPEYDPENLDPLKQVLQYHFIRKATIFDDGKKSGEFSSNRIEELTPLGIVYSKLNIANSNHNLVVTDISGQEIKVDHANANNLVQKGVVHKITSFLKF
ncbi:MAG: fasciclin domain-containing protein [Prolixibacteraceae bacterium]|nr:fasciclin domain-containing protein [Prolixibacteraceae bacterium]